MCGLAERFARVLHVGLARRFGNTVLVHFEDMSYANLSRLFNQYRGSLACFSDDVQVCDKCCTMHIIQCARLTNIY